MDSVIIESQYPILFRKQEATVLGNHLKNRHSVVLVGMKRVGISNFLRFFLCHKGIVREYISKTQKHIFIKVDLNDLVERELFPFWTLTLKRIVDTVEEKDLGKETTRYIQNLFLDSIQTQDLFLTIDSVRKALMRLVDNHFSPTLFFLRFDRIKDAVTPEFFGNLQGLRDATHQKVAYVFTSFRSLDRLSPHVFTKASLLMFAQDLYIKPARKDDTYSIFKTYKNMYRLGLDSQIEEALFDSVDGYIQYLQLALIFLHERRKMIKSKAELFDALVKDERISLQSEELWESLDSLEQNVLLKVSKGQEVTEEEKKIASYVWDTGFIAEYSGKRSLFSPLFDYHLKQRDIQNGGGISDFTKKENSLFTLLKQKAGEICEREEIVEAVWPEVEAFGVSDWAIDRLVARVRSKLKLQKSKFEIQTIKTRGYRLVSSWNQ